MSQPNKPALHVVVMGVAGCGKSAMGQQLAARLGLPLIEGDDFHPPSNIQKMQEGVALTDADRQGWLQSLASQLGQQGAGAVMTCSALKATYRNTLRAGVPALAFVHLAISHQESLRRVARRADHFYPPSLVASQFEALQDPLHEPLVLVLDGTLPLATLADQAAAWCREALSSPV
jgi:gluconokinase